MLNPRVTAELSRILPGRVLFDVSMAEHCSFRAGGRAAALALPPGRAELEELVGLLRAEKVPYLPLGRGTNLLVRDGGYPGVFVSLVEGCQGVEAASEPETGQVRITAGGGANLARVLEAAAEAGGRGLAPLSGIPGTVGGAIRMNAGPAGSKGQIGDSVAEALVLETTGKTETWDREDLQFGYRQSALRERDLVVEATLRLPPGKPEKIRAEMQGIREKKQATQPWDEPSAGSIFRNPEKEKAGQLIEEAGLKGVRVRGAKVSEVHANFIVNVGGATARDILSLIAMIKDKVRDKSGITLELELKVVGEE